MNTMKGRKPLAYLIVLALLLTMVPVGVFADVVEPQVVDQDKSTAEDVKLVKEFSKPKNIEDGKVEMDKSIRQTGVDTFEITLKVTTTETIQQVEKSQDAAVVLVIDNSNSMYYDCAICGDEYCEFHHTEKRMPGAKTAAKTFVDEFVKNNLGGKRQIAVVQFNSDGKTLLQWTEANTTQGALAVKSTIENMTIDTNMGGRGGTNIEAGLRLANNLLAVDTIKNFDNTFVVMLTDGIPTYGVGDNATTSISEIKGTGTGYTTKADYEDVPGVAKSIQAKAGGNTKLYTVNFGAKGTVGGTAVDAWLASFANQNVRVDGVTALTKAFKNIVDTIKNQIQAWVIYDPMGKFIIFDRDKNKDVAYDTDAKATLKFNTSTNTLVWDLKSETTRKTIQDNKTTYALTYFVKLDTSDPEFKEKTTYDTNGETTLSYLILKSTNGGDPVYGPLKTANFNVPQVQGTVPSYGYRVEYYKKDKTTKQYVQQQDQFEGTAKLHSTVSMSAIDENWRTKYEGDNYAFANGEPTHQITASDNVIKQYYDPIQAEVIVRHHVREVTIEENGEEVQTQDYVLVATEEPTVYAGDSYRVEKLSASGIEFERANGGELSIDKLPAGTVERDLYYKRVTDKSVPASLTVEHKYEVKTWKLVNGKYVEDTQTFNGVSDQYPTGLFKGNIQAVAPKLSVSGGDYSTVVYKLNSTSNNIDVTDKEGKPSYAVTLEGGKNTATFTYIGTLEKREKTAVTVNHHYKTISVGGDTTTTESITVDENVYVNESYKAEVVEKDNFKKTSATPSDLKINLVANSKENVINIYYERDDRKEATINVIHKYVTKTETLIMEGDKVIGSQEDISEDGQEEETPQGTFYAGQTYTATEKLTHNENTYKFVGDTKTIDPLKVGSNTIILEYQRTVDNREEADLTVTHKYQTLKSFVDEKGLIQVAVDDSQTEIVSADDDYYEGKQGDLVDVNVKNRDGHKRADENKTEKLVLNGSGKLTLIYQKKEIDDQKKAASITVKPIYVTKTTEIGADGKVTESTVTDDSPDAAKNYDNLFAGMFFNVTLSDFAKEGFSFSDSMTTDAYQNVKLKEGANQVEIYFIKEVEAREKAELTVKHHYTYVMIGIENGEYKKVEDTVTVNEAITQEIFVGQTYVAQPVNMNMGGIKITVTTPEADRTLKLAQKEGNVINVYYYGEVDVTEKTTVQVIHHYKEIDLNGTTNTSTITESAIDSFVGMNFTATENLNGTGQLENPYKRVTPAADSGLTVKLAAGENVINIYYERTIDTREATTVKVIHNYFGYDTRIDPDKQKPIDEGTYEENFNTKEAGAWVGNNFTATLRLTVGEGEQAATYKLDPVEQNQILNVTAKAEENVITLSYSRDYASQTPDPTPTPDPEPGPGPGGGGGGNTTTPPAPPTDIVDEDTPLGDAPATLPSEEEEILDEEVPLAQLPKTGGIGAAGFVAIGALIAAMGAVLRRKEEK